MILGHEALGIVDEVGDMVRDFKPGDRVIVPAITPDWGDEAEQRGYSSQTTGPLGGWKFSNFKDGVFGEFFHVNQADNNLARLPDGMSLEAGVMLPDMLSTGFMGAENANIPIGGSVAVLGIGPVGLSGIAGAKLRGAGRIFAVGTRPKPIEVAKAYGATDIISYKNGNTAEQILEATDGEGVDAVIVSGGGPDILVDAFTMAKAGSVISNNNYFGTGMFDKDYIPIPRAGWGVGMASKQTHDRALPRRQGPDAAAGRGGDARPDGPVADGHARLQGLRQDRGGAAPDEGEAAGPDQAGRHLRVGGIRSGRQVRAAAPGADRLQDADATAGARKVWNILYNVRSRPCRAARSRPAPGAGVRRPEEWRCPASRTRRMRGGSSRRP